MKKNDYSKLEEILSYHFKDSSHLDIAFTHKSYSNENPDDKRISYERYEFLGDAILEYVVSKELFLQFPMKTEGDRGLFKRQRGWGRDGLRPQRRSTVRADPCAGRKPLRRHGYRGANGRGLEISEQYQWRSERDSADQASRKAARWR